MMLTCEKQIYNRVLNIFLGHERENLAQLQNDVENMANAYRKLVDSAQSIKVVERGENPKQNAHLRLQIKQLENEKAKLERDLAESMVSMENMLKEYTQMYAGGGAKKEGVKHIENELTQLKRKISENLVEEVNEADLQDTPDFEPQSGGNDKSG
jgi:chromosome segregation ATPase